MKKLLCSFMAVILLCASAYASAPDVLDDEDTEPVRLGIMRFTSKTYDVPDGMAAVISDFFGRMLFKSDGIALLERERLEDVGAELNLGMSGLVNDKTAAKIGKIAGCQYILLGSITNLARGESGVGLPGLVPLIGGIGVSKEKVKAALDVRVVNVETAKVVFADSAEGEASKSDTGVTFYGIDFTNSEFGGIENIAIAQAASKLAPQIEKALTGKDTLTKILNPEPKKGKKSSKNKAASSTSSSSKSGKSKSRTKNKPDEDIISQLQDSEPQISASSLQPAAENTTTKPNYENKSTDPAKVIKSYGLSSGEANSLRIKHINLAKLGNTKRAYSEYVKLAEENPNDYLAAFKAGEISRNMKKKDDAREWYKKALEINPEYEPAQKALARL